MQKENRLKQLVEERTRQAFSEKGFQPLDLTNVTVSKLDIHIKDTCVNVTFPALICESPDVRVTNSGMKIAEISIATSSFFKKDNQRIEKTQWHTVTLWGRLAEVVEQYTTKGSSVYVEGRLEHEKWQDQNGTTRYTTKIVAETVQLLDKRK